MAPTNAGLVDSSNIDQLHAWDGEQGNHWADNAERFDHSVAGYHQRLLAVAAIGERDRVLDVGCGAAAIGRPTAS